MANPGGVHSASGVGCCAHAEPATISPSAKSAIKPPMLAKEYVRAFIKSPTSAAESNGIGLHQLRGRSGPPALNLIDLDSWDDGLLVRTAMCSGGLCRARFL